MNDELIKIVTVSENPDMEALKAANKRFAALMTEIIEQPDAYRGMPLDVILSMLVYALNCMPDTLGERLRALCDALDSGHYEMRKMNKKH